MNVAGAPTVIYNKIRVVAADFGSTNLNAFQADLVNQFSRA